MKLFRAAKEESVPTGHEKLSFRQWCRKLFFVILGGVLASIGLELFLIPNQIIVGGMTGVSALFAYMTEMRLGLFLFLFNLPFIFMTYRQLKKQFVLITVLGLAVFSWSAVFLHPLPALIEMPLPAAILGGLFLGCGLGLVVRYGGMLDSLEPIEATEPIYGRKRGLLSPDRLIMLVNCLILTGAGVIFGWDQAMYSIVAYLLAFELLHFTIGGFSAHRTVCIITNQNEAVKEALITHLMLHSLPEGPKELTLDEGYTLAPKQMGETILLPQLLVYRVHLLESIRLKSIVRAIDSDAVIMKVPEEKTAEVRS